jgi:hypothetical protein
MTDDLRVQLSNDLTDLFDHYDTSVVVYRDGKRRSERHTVRGPSLVKQLRDALGSRRSSPAAEHVTAGGPSSRPPGWREDISTLLTDIGMPDALVDAAITGKDLEPAELARAARRIHRWHSLALVALEYRAPLIRLDGRCTKRVYTAAGRRDVGCGAHMLMTRSDASAEVWCANPDCHDDVNHPDCRDHSTGLDRFGYPIELGYASAPLTCRDHPRSNVHAVCWSPAEWARLGLTVFAKGTA